MDIKYVYAGIVHDTVEEAQASVLVERNLLDTEPTNWIEVKAITGNSTDGWLIPPVKLNDAEINNIDDTKTYMVASIIGGENLLGLLKKFLLTEQNTQFIIVLKLYIGLTLTLRDKTQMLNKKKYQQI